MATKNIFGRGLGLGPVHWIVTRGYGPGGGPAPVVVVIPPSPTRLTIDVTNTLLGFVGEDGTAMSTPLLFAVGETGPLTVTCMGIDGTVEDLSTAASVTLRVTNRNGTVVVNGVTLTSPTALGTAVWTRTAPQVATAGDYLAQVTVVRGDAGATVGRYPDGQVGVPITILPVV